MTVAMILVARGEPDGLEDQLLFHLSAGVSKVLVDAKDASDETRELLETHARNGAITLVDSDLSDETERRTALARLAAVEHGAEWVIDSDPQEYWWPRAEGLEDAVVAIPPRYTVVHALVRPFLPATGDGTWTRRVGLGETHEPLALGDWVRPVYRASPELTLLSRGVAAEPWRVPLRAWYPIEVFRLGGDDAARAGSVVTDTRLVDAFARLRETGQLAISVPDIVDDAAYAVECAALGEADFGPIEAHIEDLEQRIAALEARFWPTVQRALRRLDPRRR
jgi:hypothetical protein